MNWPRYYFHISGALAMNTHVLIDTDTLVR